jgi:serine/threonine protein kinase
VSLYGELVLADDVEMFPIADLAPETRDAIPHSPGDFALSRSRSRDTSRVVDRDSRDLLVLFKEPTRIVDAVIHFATARGIDPESTLEGAYEMLRRFYRASVLVSLDQKEEKDRGPRLSPGTSLFGFTLAHRVHELEDTDVFFARDERGNPAAVKVVRGGRASAGHEASMMRKAGSRAPAVLAVHEWEGRGVLVSEWLFGEAVTHTASALRGRKEPRTEAGLLTLLCEVADAFAELHRAGVLHGDIHPGNVLIEMGGRARVLDLGFAVKVKGGGSSKGGGRGGVAFYMEPELAAARIRGESLAATTAGEQFAIGALLYLLWTGVHYVDWSLERSAMLKQITEAPPLSFARRHVPAWPALEAVLGRALAKLPRDRFASCAALARALRALLPEARRRDQAATKTASPARDPSRALVRDFFVRCAPGGATHRGLPANPPYASINYGAAGIAYAMYKIAVAKDDAELLASADVWADRLTALSAHAEAFHTTAIDINEESVGNASLFHSPSGVHAVRALVAVASGQSTTAARAISEFLAASRVFCEFPDLTLGKAGLLLGCAELYEATGGATGCDTAGLLLRGTELRDEIARLVSGNSFASSVSIDHLGIAHGWAGLLFALLRWCQATGTSPEPYRAKLEELASLHEPHGLGMRWPVRNRTVPRATYMDGWCNGPAGYTLLWALAHELLHDSHYGTYAERSASSAWSSELGVGTVCCGLAGIGYACAAAHRVTGEASWLTRARRAVQRAAEDRSKEFYKDSLYKGAVGVVLLSEELEASRPATPFLER